MARPPLIPPEQRLRMLPRTVNDHPWAGPGHVQALSGLRQRELYQAGRAALAQKLVEQARVPTRRNPPRRFALLPAGARLLGEPAPKVGDLRNALLRALDLDLARLLLAEWSASPGLTWALSPFTVHADDLKPAATGARQPLPDEPKKDRACRSLRLEALAALSLRQAQGRLFGARRFLHVAVIVDPGDVALTWFFHQFRSVYAWSRRPEFRNRARAFPVFVLVTANRARLGQLAQLWRACARWGTKPERLYATTRLELSEQAAPARTWWDEHLRRTRLWAGAIGVETPNCKLAQTPPGTPPLSYPVRPPGGEPATPGSGRRYGLSTWARKRKSFNARLLRDHLQVSALGRELLDRIGRYPLLMPGEPAEVLDLTRADVYPALGLLAARIGRTSRSFGGLTQPRRLVKP